MCDRGLAMEQQVHRVISAAVQERPEGERIEWSPAAKLALTKLMLIQTGTAGCERASERAV